MQQIELDYAIEKCWLELSGIKLMRFALLEASSADYALSKDYQFDLTLNSHVYLSEVKLINQLATLVILTENEPMRFHGIIIEAQFLGVEKNYHCYSLILTSPLYLLKRSRHNRVFVDKGIVEVVNEIFKAAGWVLDDYCLRLHKKYPEKLFYVQHNESDFNFLSRLLSRHGLFYTFIQHENKVVLMIYDDLTELNDDLDVQCLPFCLPTQQQRAYASVFIIQQESSLLPDTVKVIDYNYLAPDQRITAHSCNKTSVRGRGNKVVYGKNLRSQEGAQYQANLLQEQLDWQRELYHAQSDVIHLTPGMCIQLSDHPDAKFNRHYRILAIRHYAGQSGYRNELTLLPGDRPFRSDTPLTQVTQPNFIAHSEGNDQHIANLDQHGRYQIRFPFDNDNLKNKASNRVRAVQSSIMHFPLPDAAEIMVVSLNNDLEQLVILGALSNSENPNPVTSVNHTQTRFHTHAGNAVVFDDLPENEVIALFTLNQQNLIEMNASAKTPCIKVVSKQGKQFFYAKGNLSLQSKQNQEVTTGNEQIIMVNDNYYLVTRQGDTHYQSGRDIILQALHDLEVESLHYGIKLIASQSARLTAQKNVQHVVQQGDFKVQVEKGAVAIHTHHQTNFTVAGNAPIQLANQRASLSIEGDGSLTLKARSITLEAITIELRTMIKSN